MEQAQTRLVHWYDIATHRIACGAPGQLNSTKYTRQVTCAACLESMREAASGREATLASAVGE